MSPLLIVGLILAYFSLLILISWYTGRNADNDAFFLANKNSPWYIVAFGMIGASLSGVTFISVPGWVATSQFSYMQLVLGYLLGYTVIALILMPLYYRLNLTSIYTYLEQRFGFWSYKTGAAFFLLSRTLGSAFRLFIVAIVLQVAVFDHWEIPFGVSVIITIALIWLYTFRGGIKTIIWTDTFQTTFLLLSAGLTVYIIGKDLNLSFTGLVSAVDNSEYSRIFFFDDWNDKRHFIKQFFAGTFIAIVMTGLDQDMMQKNLSCRNIREAQKNMFSFSIVLVFVNLLFMSLGAMLYIYANQKGIAIPAKGDELFPFIATQGHLPAIVGVFFILGLIAAAYSSADSALTALTTSFCVDFLDINKRYAEREKRVRVRKIVHIGIALMMVGVIMIFKAINDDSVISAVFTVAGYTYGPLLGLYSFGLFTKLPVRDKLVPVVAVLSPVICYVLNIYSQQLFNGFKFGFELLIINGALTFLGLLLISKSKNSSTEYQQKEEAEVVI
jgi:Na+/proline symporter